MSWVHWSLFNMFLWHKQEELQHCISSELELLMFRRISILIRYRYSTEGFISINVTVTLDLRLLYCGKFITACFACISHVKQSSVKGTFVIILGGSPLHPTHHNRLHFPLEQSPLFAVLGTLASFQTKIILEKYYSDIFRSGPFYENYLFRLWALVQ